MPHDKNGQVLGVGDLVSIRGRVTAITPGDVDERVTLAMEATAGDGEDVVELNARQVVIVEKGSESDVAPAAAAAVAPTNSTPRRARK